MRCGGTRSHSLWRMRLRTHVLIVLVLGVLTFGAAAFQAAAASGDSSPSSTFRLVCPLH